MKMTPHVIMLSDELWICWRCPECGKRLETRSDSWVPQCGARPAYGQPRHRACAMIRTTPATTPTRAVETSNPAECLEVDASSMTNQTEEGGMKILDDLQRDTSTLTVVWRGTTVHPKAEHCAYLARRANVYLPAALDTLAASRPDGYPTTTPGSGSSGGGSGGVHSVVETAIINADRAHSPARRYAATITALNEAVKTVAALMVVDPLDDIAPVEDLFRDLRGWLDCAWEAAQIRLTICAGSVNGCRANAAPGATLCETCQAQAQAARDTARRARKAAQTRQNRRTNRKTAA